MSHEEPRETGGSGPREDVFEDLIRLHRAELTRFAVRQLGEHAEQAEDVVQEALLNAHKAISRGTQPDHPRAWLFTIVHNAAVNATRGVRSTDEIDERIGSTPDQGVPEAVEQAEWIDWLMEAVGQLPARQRDALIGHAFEGRSYREIAARQTTTVSAVKSLLGRARRALAADPSLPAAGIGAPLLLAGRRLRSLLARGPLAGKAGGTKGLVGILGQAALTATVTTGVLMAAHGGTLGSGLAATPHARLPHAKQHGPHTCFPRSAGVPAREEDTPGEGRRAVSECIRGGAARGRYSEAALQFAAHHLPAGALEYTDCERQLELLLQVGRALR